MSSEEELVDQYEYYAHLLEEDCNLDERVLYNQQLQEITVEHQARFCKNILKDLHERRN